MKFGIHLQEFQYKPKRFRLHLTSGLIFFIMQIVKIAVIFPKKLFENIPCVNILNCFWFGVVIELISSNWKVIATCADLYITDILCN